MLVAPSCSSARGRLAACRRAGVPAAAGRRRRRRPVPRPGVPVVPGQPRADATASPPGTVVRAAAAGTVTFSGVVAGTRYVVVEHADGLRATYGGLASTPLRGRRRRRRRRRSSGVAGRRAALRAAHAATTYVDPAPLLGRLVERARLVPTDGTPPPPAAAAARCACPRLTARRADRADRPVRPAGRLARSAHRPVGRPITAPATTCGRSGAGGGSRQPQRRICRWLSSPCARCSRPASTSDTRPGAGTRR